MKSKIISTLYTILAIAFFPFIFVIIKLAKYLSLATFSGVLLILSYVFITNILGLLTLNLELKSKKILVIHEIICLVALLFVYFNTIYLYVSDVIVISTIAVLFMSSGVIGLITNTVTIGRGLPHIYSKDYLYGKIFNYFIITVGLAVFVLFMMYR